MEQLTAIDGIGAAIFDFAIGDMDDLALATGMSHGERAIPAGYGFLTYRHRIAGRCTRVGAHRQGSRRG
jgi:hypothetical protein